MGFRWTSEVAYCHLHLVAVSPHLRVNIPSLPTGIFWHIPDQVLGDHHPWVFSGPGHGGFLLSDVFINGSTWCPPWTHSSASRPQLYR